ncbi:MAG: trypsin-like serine protease [Acidimicrobiia bacterium]|nr:trypsin-like serine protease [Acidimicrobiia bacterium]
MQGGSPGHRHRGASPVRRSRRARRVVVALVVCAAGIGLAGLPAGGTGQPATPMAPAAPAEMPGGTVSDVVASAVLDAASALAGMVSSDGTLPAVLGEIAAPRDEEGLYLAPGPGLVTSEHGGAPSPGTAEGAGTESLAPEEEAFALASVVAGASVIGVDDRAAVVDTTSSPFRAIAHVSSDSTQCTGWLVGADLVLTAGHCVYDYTGFVRSLVITPARNGDMAPFGRCGAVRAYTTRTFVEGGDLASDWGIIELDCRVGDRTGWFGLRVADDAVVGRTVVVSGYPMDRPKGTQWWATEYVRAAYAGQLAYGGDTYAGQSGSPVHLVDGSCTPCGVAVHAYGVGATPDGYNSGTRVTAAVVAVVAALRAR